MAKMTLARRRRHQRDDPDLWRRVQYAAATVVVVLLAGTIGYIILGLGFVDALYQTVITVSTVGYREVGDVDTGYKFFTIGLILLGAGSVLYTVGVLLETLVEGRITKEFGRRRMDQLIESMRDHTIVCGWGQVGQAISATLTTEGRGVVVIDRNPEINAADRLIVVGDATDDDVLPGLGWPTRSHWSWHSMELPTTCT